MARHESFHVRPRYTPGSPAMVNPRLCRRVAEEERQAIQGHLEGVYGPAEVERAKRLGLHRIALHTVESKGGLTVTDLLTSEQYRREGKYAAGQRVEVWSDEHGWVPHIVATKYNDGPTVLCRDIPAEAWQAVATEYSRDLVRSAQSVRVLEPEQLAEVLL